MYLELKALFSKSLKNPDIYGKLAYKKNVQIIKSWLYLINFDCNQYSDIINVVLQVGFSVVN